jgi:hypothetical protein
MESYVPSWEIPMAMRPKFQALDGREYDLSVTMGTVKRIERDIGHRLSTIFIDDGLRARWFGDDVAFGELLWVVVKPQAEAAGVSQERFDETLDGPTTRAAHRELLRACSLFFEEPLQGQIVLMVEGLDRFNEIARTESQTIVAAARERLGAMDLQTLLTQLTPTSSDSSSPASAA